MIPKMIMKKTTEMMTNSAIAAPFSLDLRKLRIVFSGNFMSVNHVIHRCAGGDWECKRESRIIQQRADVEDGLINERRGGTGAKAGVTVPSFARHANSDC